MTEDVRVAIFGVGSIGAALARECIVRGCEIVAAVSNEAVSKCKLLAKDKEIADPIGQPQRVYDNCAELIEKAVKEMISELVI